MIKELEAFYGTQEPPNLVKCHFYTADGELDAQIETKMESLGWSLWEVWGMVESDGLIYAELLPLA